MKEERWLPVVGYEGLYEVSDFGRVRSLDRFLPFKGTIGVRRGGLKTTRPATGGYHVVGLGSGGVYSTLKVHRLVARAFIGEPPIGSPTVNHIDFVRDNNRATNLEYCSQKVNVNHSLAAGRMHLRTGKSRSKGVCVDDVDKAVALMVLGGSTDKDIAAKYGLPRGYLSKIRGGKSWNTPDGGFPDRLGIRSKRRKRLSVAEAVWALEQLRGGASLSSVSETLGTSTRVLTDMSSGKTWGSLITAPP